MNKEDSILNNISRSSIIYLQDEEIKSSDDCPMYTINHYSDSGPECIPSFIGDKSTKQYYSSGSESMGNINVIESYYSEEGIIKSKNKIKILNLEDNLLYTVSNISNSQDSFNNHQKIKNIEHVDDRCEKDGYEEDDEDDEDDEEDEEDEDNEDNEEHEKEDNKRKNKSNININKENNTQDIIEEDVIDDDEENNTESEDITEDYTKSEDITEDHTKSEDIIEDITEDYTKSEDITQEDTINIDEGAINQSMIKNNENNNYPISDTDGLFSENIRTNLIFGAFCAFVFVLNQS